MIFPQHTKVRVVNEDNGSEWTGYLREDHGADARSIRLWVPETGSRPNIPLRPEYRLEVI